MALTIKIKELQQNLIPLIEETRAKLSMPGISKAGIAHYAALQRVLGRVLMFLGEANEKGEINMKDLAKAFSVEVVDMADVKVRQRKSKVYDLITEKVKTIQPGKAIPIDRKIIAYTYLQGVIRKMKAKKLLDESIRVVKQGENVFLGKEA